ncbi:MAG TPA: hypothetical protein VFS11_10785 [Gemmatimonadales bacterium]|nr:hypothetical protein [Gemmatimonadales bacterium]
MTPIRTATVFAASSVLATALLLGACSSADDASTQPSASGVAPDRAGYDQPGTHRQYGRPVQVGNGTVRTYIVLDQKRGGVPLEVGVAMSESVMEGLPAAAPATGAAAMQHGEHAKGNPHANMNVYLLDLPAQNPTPYQFVQFDWNPAGHEPEGVYDLPHFDFHFYTVPVSVRNAIVPTDPEYAAKAANFPAAEFRAPFYLDAATPVGIPPALATVPQMGLHWLDVRSPELQVIAGHPENYQPFTKTFIYGSWDGQFIFDEPMITRAYIMSKRDASDPAVRDEVIPVPTAARYTPAGYYPSAYRIAWDAQAKEYRVALTQLAWRD